MADNTESTYWVKAVMKDGSVRTHYTFRAKYDDVLKYAHSILDEDKDVEYCVPCYVTVKELEINIKRKG